MIKIERKSEGASIFRGDACWDLNSDIEYKIKVFGITIFHRKHDRKWDFIENGKKPGFKNGE